MENVTFVIHTRIDGKERLANFDFCIHFLRSNFNAQIIVVEVDISTKVEDRKSSFQHVFVKSNDHLFNRTRATNIGVRDYVKTKFVCLLDMDVFLDPQIYIDAVKLLDTHSLVYPFCGVFYDIPQHYNTNYALTMADVDTSCIKLLNTDSVGGLQFVRTEDFINAGMTNELFIGWGYEDREFYERFKNLGYSIARTDNHVYHFSHPRSYNSDGRSPHIKENEREYNKVRNMDREQLLNYINKYFYWCK